MNIINEITSYISSIPSETWTSLWTYVGGATLVATTLQVLKHKFAFSEAKKVVTLLLGLFSFIVVFADYILAATSQNPTALGRNTAVVVGVAVFVHRFAVSPIYAKVVVTLTSLVSDANAYRASIAPTPEPVAEAPAEVPTFQV